MNTTTSFSACVHNGGSVLTDSKAAEPQHTRPGLSWARLLTLEADCSIIRWDQCTPGCPVSLSTLPTQIDLWKTLAVKWPRLSCWRGVRTFALVPLTAAESGAPLTSG